MDKLHLYIKKADHIANFALNPTPQGFWKGRCSTGLMWGSGSQWACAPGLREEDGRDHTTDSSCSPGLFRTGCSNM